MQNLQIEANNPDDGINDTIVDFLVADSDFALVLLLLVANNLVQFSLYILFTQLEIQTNPVRQQDKPSSRDTALILAAQLRTDNFAQF